MNIIKDLYNRQTTGKRFNRLETALTASRKLMEKKRDKAILESKIPEHRRHSNQQLENMDVEIDDLERNQRNSQNRLKYKYQKHILLQAWIHNEKYLPSIPEETASYDYSSGSGGDSSGDY